MKTVEAFRGMPKGIQEIELGKPLLFSHEDNQRMCDALIKAIPSEVTKRDAIVYMGHGSHHQANVYYSAIQYYLWQQRESLYMATVEGFPSLDNVISYLEKNRYKTIYLIPFMTIAGDHARNDMASDEDDSWKSILESKGYKVKPILTGLGDNKLAVDIWIDHLKILVEKM